MNKGRRISVLIVVFLVVCLVAFAIELQTNIIKRTIDNFIYDNKNHYLSCDKLPAEAIVREIILDNQAVVFEIERVNPGFVGVDIETTACPGKADLVIWFASHQDRLEIERIISNDTFYGVPFRLQNR